MMKRLVAVAAFVALCTSPIFAGDLSFGVGGGLTMPMGDYGDVDGMGFHLDGAVNIPIGSQGLGARIDALFSSTGHDSVEGIDVGGSTKIIGAMGSLVYEFGGEGSAKPYVLGGLGLHNIDASFDIEGVDLDLDASETKLSFGGGAGVAFPVGGANLFAEGRIIIVTTSDSSTTFIPLTVGVRFGGGGE